jgi:O-antigen/teichoic acid export membrane protein
MGFPGTIFSFVLLGVANIALSWSLGIKLLIESGIKLSLDNFFRECWLILEFGLPFYSSNFLTSFIGLPLLGLVSRSAGVEQVGYLRIAQSLSQFITFLPVTLAPVFISKLSESFAGDHSVYQKNKSIHLRFFWSVSLFITILVTYVIPYVVTATFGTSYEDAVIPSQLMAWAALMTTMSGVLSQSLMSEGSTKTIGLTQTLGLSINVFFAFVLIPKYSAIGFVMAQALSSSFTFLIYIKISLSGLPGEDKKRILALSIATIFLLIFSLLSSFIITIFYLYLASLFMALIIFMYSFSLLIKREEKELIFAKLKKYFV